MGLWKYWNKYLSKAGQKPKQTIKVEMTVEDKIKYMQRKIRRGRRVSEEEAVLIGQYSHQVLNEVDEGSKEAEEVIRLLVAL